MSPTDADADISAVARFAGTIAFPTVSSLEAFSLEPFHRMREYSMSRWPGVFSTMKLELHGEASMLLEWRGASAEGEPLLLTAHQDVVPQGSEDWSFDPFGGEVKDGRIQGRGTIDYKSGFAGMLEACEQLINRGFRPERPVFLAFGHDEEVGGLNGAGRITASLIERGVFFSSVLDEGGYIQNNVNGAEEAVVAIAEKGYATFRISAEAVQGHSSAPPGTTAIGILARALCLLENLKIFDPELPDRFQGLPFSGTTLAPTVISGGCKENVLPSRAAVLVNTRPAPLSSVDSVHKQITDALKYIDVTVELLQNPSVSEPSELSDTDSSDYRSLAGAVSSVLGDSFPVVPGVFSAATDSRRYCSVARDVYRFMPVRLGKKGIGALHSTNESISVEDYLNCVRFYAQYITRAALNS